MLHHDAQNDNLTAPETTSADSAALPTEPAVEPSEWPTVLSMQPCPVCRAERDCRRSSDRKFVACRHVEDHLGTPVTGRDGLTYTVFDLSNLRRAVAAEVEQALRLFHPTGVIELRVLGKGEKEPTAGYFDSPAKAAKEAAKCECPDDSAKFPQGIYFVLNPLHLATFARADANRLIPRLQPLASDRDVLRLRWVFIDCDPDRPAGVPATSDELASAARLADAVKVWLRGMGFTDPVEAASGNGRHLLYPIDLPNDPEHRKLVQQVHRVLADDEVGPAVGLLGQRPGQRLRVGDDDRAAELPFEVLAELVVVALRVVTTKPSSAK